MAMLTEFWWEIVSAKHFGKKEPFEEVKVKVK